MPMIIAPIAGAMSDRIGGGRRRRAGLALQAAGLAWIAAVSTPTTPYVDIVGPFVLAGIGMLLFFAPVANVVLSSVRDIEQGQASGVNNAIRELGGVLGVDVLASIFAHEGGYTSADHLRERDERGRVRRSSSRRDRVGRRVRHQARPAGARRSRPRPSSSSQRRRLV